MRPGRCEVAVETPVAVQGARGGAMTKPNFRVSSASRVRASNPSYTFATPYTPYTLKTITLSLHHGRQASRSATARSFTISLHRYWLRRHDQVRVDVQHPTRLAVKLHRPCPPPTIHEHWSGTAHGEDETAVSRAHDPTHRTASEGE